MNNKEMIVITECKTVMIPSFEWYYNALDYTAINPDDIGIRRKRIEKPDEWVNVKRGHVMGRVFKDHYGREICVGLTGEAADSLGIIYKFIDQQKKEIEELTVRCVNLSYQLKEANKEVTKFNKPPSMLRRIYLKIERTIVGGSLR
jgi:hypothetical protein